jgi:hypothetical protein
MQHTVDEHGGRSAYLARRCPTLDVAGHAQEYGSANPVSVEPRDVELELGRVLPQAVVFECRLAMKEQRNAKRTSSPTRLSTRSISRNACRENGHS